MPLKRFPGDVKVVPLISITSVGLNPGAKTFSSTESPKNEIENKDWVVDWYTCFTSSIL